MPSMKNLHLLRSEIYFWENTRTLFAPEESERLM
jgi:hypothetical protein